MTGDPRERAASALRDLGHALVRHDADPALLTEVAEAAEALADRLAAGGPRQRDLLAEALADPPRDGERLSHNPDCVVSGPANPHGLALEVRRDGDGAAATLTLERGFEGPPGRAHGGMVAAAFDDVMGYLLAMRRLPALTVELDVRYHAAAPLGAPLAIAAQVRSEEGRKVATEATLRDPDGTVVAEAEALFVVIPAERLGLSDAARARLAEVQQQARALLS
ncbi:MAG: PaaI family thioesterase [Egibacteraceae bacterium]